MLHGLPLPRRMTYPLRSSVSAIGWLLIAVSMQGMRPASATVTSAALPSPGTPTLLAPEDGADFNTSAPASLTFEWTAVDGATGYLLLLGPAGAPPDTMRTTQTSLTLLARELPPGIQITTWRVVAVDAAGPGPPTEPRTFRYVSYRPDVLRLADGSPAFVEIVGPGGVAACRPEAQSTEGCDEVGGNGIMGSLNSTGAYLGGERGRSSVESLPIYAPSDFEIRFTEAGSYAIYPFVTGTIIRVPFEIWDIGVTGPNEVNDPSDDVQMIPALEAVGSVECRFGFVDPTLFGEGKTTQRIYAYYGRIDYRPFDSLSAQAVNAASNGCALHPSTTAALGHVDIGRGRPLQHFVLEQAGAGSIDDLAGTVIRFYTTDSVQVSSSAEPGLTSLTLSSHPNPIWTTATVRFTLATDATVRLRLVDVLGREVAVVVDGPQTAGEHRPSLDASRLAPGLYVLVLDANGERLSRTVTIVR